MFNENNGNFVLAKASEKPAFAFPRALKRGGLRRVPNGQKRLRVGRDDDYVRKALNLGLERVEQM